MEVFVAGMLSPAIRVQTRRASMAADVDRIVPLPSTRVRRRSNGDEDAFMLVVRASGAVGAERRMSDSFLSHSRATLCHMSRVLSLKGHPGTCR